MEQTTTQVITKLQSEYDSLVGKLVALEHFIICKDYMEVSDTQKTYLAKQHLIMEQYKEVLMKRIVDLRYQGKKDREEELKRRAELPGDTNGTPAD